MADSGRLVYPFAAVLFGMFTLPIQTLAACEVETASLRMESIPRGADLGAVFGSIESGIPRLGSAAPSEIQIKNCSATQPTNVRVANPFVRLGGNDYAPVLVAVNGERLAVPVFLHGDAGFDFIGNPRLTIALVPVRRSIAISAGTFSDSLIFVFVD